MSRPDAAPRAAESVNPEVENTLWTATDVARYLKVSRSWVYHRAEAGLLPYLRIGGLIRFEPAIIRQYAHHGAPDVQRPHALPSRPRALRTGR